jgi:hypothetical protein
MALPWLVDIISMVNAVFHRWMKAFFTPRYLQVVFTQCFFGAMVTPLLVGAIPMENATFHA